MADGLKFTFDCRNVSVKLAKCEATSGWTTDSMDSASTGVDYSGRSVAENNQLDIFGYRTANFIRTSSYNVIIEYELMDEDTKKIIGVGIISKLYNKELTASFKLLEQEEKTGYQYKFTHSFDVDVAGEKRIGRIIIQKIRENKSRHASDTSGISGDKNDSVNTLRPVRIGSGFHSKTGEFKTSHVHGIKRHITTSPLTKNRFIASTSYVSSEDVFNISGSAEARLGAFGLSVAMSGGLSNAKSSRVKLGEASYQIIVSEGIESIDYENITGEDLLKGLSGAMIESLELIITSYSDFLKHFIKEDEKDKSGSIEDAFLKWLSTSNKFIEKFGDAMVTEVIWGAVGELKFKRRGDASGSAYMWEANVAVENAATSVSTAFGGQGSTANETDYVEVTASVAGKAVSDAISNWEKQMIDVGKGTLLHDNPYSVAPRDIKMPALKPARVDRIDPDEEKHKKLQKQLAELLDVETKVAEISGKGKDAGDQARKFVDDFIKSKDKGDAAKAPEGDNPETLKFASVENSYQSSKSISEALNMITESLNKRIYEPRHLMLGEACTQSIDLLGVGQLTTIGDSYKEKNHQYDETGDFTPVGVKLVSVQDLFPFIAPYNLIAQPDLRNILSGSEDLLALNKVSTLSVLYRTISQIVADLKHPSNSGGISHNLIDGAYEAFDAILQKSMGQGQANERLAGIIDQSLNNSSPYIKRVSDVWDDNMPIRKADLGFVIVLPSDSGPLTPTLRDTDLSNTSWKRDNLNRLSYHVTMLTVQSGNESITSNLQLFSSALKLIPYICPEGHIYMMGPLGYLLSSVDENSAGFVDSTEGAMKFTLVDNKISKGAQSEHEADVSEYLVSATICAYPVSLSDVTANGVLVAKWIGTTIAPVSRNIGDFGDAILSLKNAFVTDQAANTFELSKWKSASYLDGKSLRPRYLGLQEFSTY